MEQEVLSILLADISEYNVNRLCELCNIRDYQAIKYISLYQRLDNNIRQLVGMDTTNFVKNRDKVLHKRYCARLGDETLSTFFVFYFRS